MDDDRDDVRGLLAARLPGRAVRSVAALGEGLEHRAYEVDGDLVVRFAKDDGRAVEREARLLAEVARVSPVPVPEPVFVDPAAGCIAYRKLPGVPLMDVAPSRRLAAAASVGATLGELLEALHSAPGPAELAGVDHDPMDRWLAEAAELLPAIAGELDQRSRAAVEDFLASAPPAGVAAGVFSHNDLGIEHVIVDPGSLAVTGVIDWSDAAVCDPAYDFGLLLRDLGPDGLDAALGPYGRPDPGLRDRALFYARCAAIEDLSYGLDSGRGEYARKSLDGMAWLFPG